MMLRQLQKVKLDPHLTPHIKMDLRWSIHLNIIAKNKPFEEYTRENL